MSDLSNINAAMGRYQPAAGNDTILASMGNGQPAGFTPPPITLGALSLSDVTGGTVGQPFSATISGKTAGSTIAINIAGLSVSGTAISGTPTEAGTISLTEALAGASNSPRTTGGLATIVLSGDGPNAQQLATNLTGMGANYGPASWANLLEYRTPIDITNGNIDLATSVYDAAGNIPNFATLTQRIRLVVKSPGPNRTLRIEWDARSDSASAIPVGLPSGTTLTTVNGKPGFTWNTGPNASIFEEGNQVDFVPGANGSALYNFRAYEPAVPIIDGWRQDYRDDLKRDYRGFLRFMDLQFSNTNWDKVYTDTDRPLPTDTFDYRLRGRSLESMILLSKATGIPAWICIPLKADQSFVIRLVLLAIQHGVIVYIEVGNEIWNLTGPFALNNIAFRRWWTDRYPSTGGTDLGNGTMEDAIAAWAARHAEVMGWVKAAADAAGATVGRNGQFRRVLGSQQQHLPWLQTLLAGVFKSADQSQTFTFDVAGRTDYVSPSGYFGDNAVTTPTPTTDVALIHYRMRLEADAMRANLQAHKTLLASAPFASNNIGLILYEMNHHILLPDDPAGNTLLNAITQSPLMRQTLGYALYLIRLVDPTIVIGMFAHVGQRYRWFVKHYLDTQREDEPIYDAMLAHGEGAYMLPSPVIINAPMESYAEGDIISYTPVVRGGSHVGRTTPTFSNFRNPATGVATTAAARGLSFANGTLSGTLVGVAPLAFDINYGDSLGQVSVTRSFDVTAGSGFTFVEDARSVGGTAEPLSARGWTNAGNQRRLNGAVRGTNTGDESGLATHSAGATGIVRRMVIELDRRAYDPAMFPVVRFALFAGGLNIRINHVGHAQVYDGGQIKTNLSAQGEIPNALCTLMIEHKNGKLYGELNGVPLANSGMDYALSANDTATTGIGTASINVGDGVIYTALSVKVET